jgi:hypothetical protein
VVRASEIKNNRRATRPSFGSVQSRLKQKKHQSAQKRQRRVASDD